MKHPIFTKAATLAASLMLFAGCVSQQAPSSPPGAPHPPPDQEEVVPPQPNLTFIWTPGYWDRQGNNWVWIRGHWGPRPRPGAIWIRGGWMQRDGHLVWVHPHWR